MMLLMPPELVSDLTSSMIGGLGCLLVVGWIARTPERSVLERRSVPLLANLGAVFLLRSFGWMDDQHSSVRWWAFWPATIHPLVMGIFVEGLLRRHLPRWLKYTSLGMTLSFIAVHLLPQAQRSPVMDYYWPAGMAVIMGLLARQMWVMRDAGLSREEQRMIAAVTMAAIIAIPLTVTDSGYWKPTLPSRLGAIGGLLFTRTLVTPATADGVRDVIEGLFQALARAVLISGVALLVTPAPTVHGFMLVLPVTLCMLLLIDIFDRLRRRYAGEDDGRLLRWLVATPLLAFSEWREAVRQAPLSGDSLVLEGSAIAQYDLGAITRLLDKDGPIMRDSTLQLARASATRSDADAVEQLLDLLETHTMTHVGLISESPPRIFVANVAELAARGATLRLAVILRSGREAAARSDQAAAARIDGAV